MDDCWLLYRFDHARYKELRPALRRAMDSEALAAIDADPTMEPILASLDAGETSITEARALYVQALCCVGDPLTFDRSFPRFVTSIAKYRETEDAADLLRDLLAGQKNLEAWMLPSMGLAGFLTPEEADFVRRSCLAALGGGRMLAVQRDGRPARRGGLVGSIRSFFRRLFDRETSPEELLLLLRDLLESAARSGQGLAIISA